LPPTPKEKPNRRASVEPPAEPPAQDEETIL
jgi:hypothetical protein